jgi:uncharacterized membrane protein
MIEFAYKPDWLVLLVGGALVLALLYWSYRSARGQAKPGRRWLLLGLRCLVLGILVICLLDPQRVKELRQYAPGQIAVLLDTSRSMAWEERGKSRLDGATAWLREELQLPSTLLPVHYSFSDDLELLTDLESARAEGDRTDLAAVLGALLDLSEVAPAGVVLISDGADQSDPEKIGDIARRFARQRIPIHALTVGETNEPPDVVVENVRVRRVVPDQARVRASVTLRSPGFEGGDAKLRIIQDDRALAERTIELVSAGQSIDIEFDPVEPGFQTFTAEIAPMPGERLEMNNRLEFGLTVKDERINVLYMEASGVQQGIFQPLFLKHALEDAPDIEITTLYSEQFGAPRSLYNQVAHVDPKNGDRIYRVQHNTRGFPRRLEDLLRFDVIISSDVAKENFTPQQLDDTVAFVLEHGGGFVMVGGHTAFGIGGYHNTVIDRIIPVAMALEQDVMDTTFRPRVPEAAWNHPLMQLGNTEAERRAIWTGKFPPLQGFNRVDRAKPGATVLLEHPALRSGSGEPYVLLAAQEIGKGRTMAMTFDTTFWWGEHFQAAWGEPAPAGESLAGVPNDARYYQQFWRSAVRWLAANKRGGQYKVELMLARTHAEPGAVVPVEVEVLDASGKPAQSVPLTLEVVGPGDELTALETRFDEAKGRHIANATVKGTGSFQVRAGVIDAEGRVIEDSRLLVGNTVDREMLDVRAQPRRMAELARASGGQTLQWEGNAPGAVAARLGEARTVSVEYERSPLWDTWVWLAAIIGLLTVEWVVRRTGGLA